MGKNVEAGDPEKNAAKASVRRAGPAVDTLDRSGSCRASLRRRAGISPRVTFRSDQGRRQNGPISHLQIDEYVDVLLIQAHCVPPSVSRIHVRNDLAGRTSISNDGAWSGTGWGGILGPQGVAIAAIPLGIPILEDVSEPATEVRYRRLRRPRRSFGRDRPDRPGPSGRVLALHPTGPGCDHLDSAYDRLPRGWSVRYRLGYRVMAQTSGSVVGPSQTLIRGWTSALTLRQ